MSTFNIGLDIGSTTAKIVVLDNKKNMIFSRYKRHQANVMAVLKEELTHLRSQIGAASIKLKVTGSVGMGLAEKFKLAFEQEVIAATKFVKEKYPEAATLIDIGGEDAKIVYISPDGSCDLRMNGNCAGGTGAFLDQMAVLLGIPVEELNGLAEKAKTIHYIASRCGVFAKTDIQNLLSKNVSREDIAASIFHAVAAQVITTLSHGCTIRPKILLCGGPLTFMPQLRKALMDALQIPYVEFIVPENANLIPAYGTALSAADAPTITKSSRRFRFPVYFGARIKSRTSINNPNRMSAAIRISTGRDIYFPTTFAPSFRRRRSGPVNGVTRFRRMMPFTRPNTSQTA